MSSVASIGGGSNLYQWLQQIIAQGQSGTIAPPSTTATTSNTPTTSTTTSIEDSDGDNDGSTGSSQTQGASGHHHHHHGGSNKGISTQLESAITSALGSANGSSNPNQVIQTAITNFLQAGTQGTTGTSPQGVTDPNASGTANTGALSVSDPASQQAAFVQTLQSNGINAKQLQQDLQSALQNASGGTVDFSKVFQNFPPGAFLDTTA